ncbi:MAG: hypothetical protein R2827_05325 [Bdellovibrionales bacterium]
MAWTHLEHQIYKDLKQWTSEYPIDEAWLAVVGWERLYSAFAFDGFRYGSIKLHVNRIHVFHGWNWREPNQSLFRLMAWRKVKSECEKLKCLFSNLADFGIFGLDGTMPEFPLYSENDFRGFRKKIMRQYMGKNPKHVLLQHTTCLTNWKLGLCDLFVALACKASLV